MDNAILVFLDAYKRLDELCRQILSCDRGISEYIEVMSNARQGYMIVTCWEKDYKQLKRMRWIRNRLVHDSNSFQDNLVKIEDIEWLKSFHVRIMKRTDPLSLLHHSRNIRTETITLDNYPENYLQKDKPAPDRNIVLLILIGIILLAIFFFTIMLTV